MRPVKQDAGASGDDRGCRKGVAGHVEEGAAHVDVAGHSPEKRGDYAIHHHAGGGHNHHQFRLDGDWSAEAVDGFDGDPDGDDDERGGIDEGGQYAGALVAEGLGVGGRAGLKIDCNKTEQERQEIGDVVARFREQGKRVGAQSGDKGDDHVRQRGDEREAQNGLCPGCTGGRRRGVDMHSESVNGVGYGAPTVARGPAQVC